MYHHLRNHTISGQPSYISPTWVCWWNSRGLPFPVQNSLPFEVIQATARQCSKRSTSACSLGCLDVRPEMGWFRRWWYKGRAPPTIFIYGGFAKIGVKPPKWMVKIMENSIKMDDLGGKPTILGNTHVFINPSSTRAFSVEKYRNVVEQYILQQFVLYL